MDINVERLFHRLGYQFQDLGLAERALTHRSVGGNNNERLEFLGDSILGFVIAENLFSRFPNAKEGALSRLRSLLVKRSALAQLAREFDLGAALKLGIGELKSGGYRRESILADTMEALIGAIYLDTGIEACRDCILQWYDSRLQQLTINSIEKDPKTRLQEYLQSRQIPLPNYRVLSTDGKAHAQVFHVECDVGLLEEKTYGKGTNRRVAEQEAAMEALISLGIYNKYAEDDSAKQE